MEDKSLSALFLDLEKYLLMTYLGFYYEEDENNPGFYKRVTDKYFPRKKTWEELQKEIDKLMEMKDGVKITT